MDLLLDVCDQIDGRSFCPLGDAASWALRSNVKLFRDEFEEHVRLGRCPFEPDQRVLESVGATGLGAAGVTPQPSEGIPSDEWEGA